MGGANPRPNMMVSIELYNMIIQGMQNQVRPQMGMNMNQNIRMQNPGMMNGMPGM